MPGLLKRLFAVESLVGSTPVQGELPTTREAYRNLTQIALPSVLEMVLTSLIGSIDTMMVGTLGSAAIAAVGLVGQPRMLMLSLFFALNIGVTAVVARRKGEGRQVDANRTLRSAIVMMLALSGVLMAVLIPLARPLMIFAGAMPDTVEEATTYFRILGWVLPLNALSMGINAAQRGVGNTRITMYCNVTANLVNVLFNYLLIGGNLGFPKLGVAGAAYATAIGFTVGFIMAVTALVRGGLRGDFLHVHISDNWKPDGECVKSVLKVGGNALIEQVALRIGFFSYAKIVASLGTISFAAHQICMQFLNLSFTFADGVGVAGTSLVGQMLGRKRPDLSTVYGKCAQRMAFVISLMIATAVALLRGPAISLFLSEADENAEAVRQIAMQVMLIVALFQPFQMSSVVISGCLRGAGDNRFVAGVMMACVMCIRPLMALMAVHVLHLGLAGAWMASLVDMTVRMVLVMRRFAGGKWHAIKV